MKLTRLIILSFLLVGCQPYLTYEELNEGAKTDPKIAKRLERFERQVPKADAFFREQYSCQMIWSCVDMQPRDLEKKPFTGIDDMMKTYHRQKSSCDCMSLEDAWRRIR